MTQIQTHDKASIPRGREDLAGLLADISAGDEAAFSSFYDQTSSMVYGLAKKILFDVEDSEEVMMEVYMQVWEKASQYDSTKAGPMTWLLMITRTRSIDKLRSGSKRNTLEISADEEFSEFGLTPEDEKYVNERRNIVNKALSMLGDKQRKAIELAYFYGLSQNEIANEMNEPLGTVKSWIRLGMNKLREQLEIFKEELN